MIGIEKAVDIPYIQLAAFGDNYAPWNHQTVITMDTINISLNSKFPLIFFVFLFSIFFGKST